MTYARFAQLWKKHVTNRAGVPDIPNPPTPPISCVALGLIKSIKETPQEWNRQLIRSNMFDYAVLFRYQHEITKVSVDYYSLCDDGFRCEVSLIDLTGVETQAIGRAARTHLYDPLILAKRLAHEETLAKTAFHFARLGCPSSP